MRLRCNVRATRVLTVGLMLAALCVTWATDAAAACVPAAAGKLRAAAATAMAPGHTAQPLAPTALLGLTARSEPASAGGIVGLWRTVYTIKAPGDPELDGAVFDEAFQIFNTGGTEMMLSNGLPPGLGNVCIGAWEQSGHVIKVRHVAWEWAESDEGGTALAGEFLMQVTLKVTRDGSGFEGVWRAQSVDLEGNEVYRLSGVVRATRIGVN